MRVQLDYLVISNAPFTLQAEQRHTFTVQFCLLHGAVQGADVVL
jgi:hypothetical protein